MRRRDFHRYFPAPIGGKGRRQNRYWLSTVTFTGCCLELANSKSPSAPSILPADVSSVTIPLRTSTRVTGLNTSSSAPIREFDAIQQASLRFRVECRQQVHVAPLFGTVKLLAAIAKNSDQLENLVADKLAACWRDHYRNSATCVRWVRHRARLSEGQMCRGGRMGATALRTQRPACNPLFLNRSA